MNEWNMREVKEVRWHKRKWRCATADKQITGRADCDSMWEKMVYMKTLILSGGRGACRHSSTPADQRRFKERNTVNERCVLFPFCEIVADNHLQHTSGITALILSAVKWFYRASFPSRCFLLLDFTTFLLHETSSHLRSGVHQEEFFWGGNGMYEMWYRCRSGAACLRVLIYSTTRVRVFFASRPVSSLAHISIYVTTKKTLGRSGCYLWGTRRQNLRLRHRNTPDIYRLSHTRTTLQHSQKRRGRVCSWLKLRAVSASHTFSPQRARNRQKLRIVLRRKLHETSEQNSHTWMEFQCKFVRVKGWCTVMMIPRYIPVFLLHSACVQEYGRCAVEGM